MAEHVIDRDGVHLAVADDGEGTPVCCCTG